MSVDLKTIHNRLNSTNLTSSDDLDEHHNLPDSNEMTNQAPEPFESAVDRDHAMPENEEKWYYFGLRGNGYLWRAPRLIYRTSKEKFPLPYHDIYDITRKIQLLTVHNHEKLSKNNLWDAIRDETAAILDRNQIKFTSIDLVRFRWEELARTHTSPIGYTTGVITIWIGVLPHSTSSSQAFEASQEILKTLKHHEIDEFDIAFRESVIRPFARSRTGSKTPATLFAPVNDFDPRKGFIEPLTTAIGLPIVAVDSPKTSEGTLGFYFKAGEDLYGVTARHVLFPTVDGNEMYSYNEDTAQPKKYVALMSPQTFDDVRGAIRYKISSLEKDLERSPESYFGPAVGQEERDKTQAKIVKLKEFSETLVGDWYNTNDRIIGHVVWSPPISGLNPESSEGYLRDVCVIKLDKDKFMPNMVGNSIDVGTIMDTSQLMCHLYPRRGEETREYPPDFDYPHGGLYHITRILPVSKMHEPNVLDPKSHPTRFIIRTESKSLSQGGPCVDTDTAIGVLNGYTSRVRHYNLLGTFDSIEMAIFPSKISDAPFSTPGHSGTAIVGSNNDFVAQLTSGTGSSEKHDINYATPMEWLWDNVIKPKFPDGDLVFDVPITDLWT